MRIGLDAHMIGTRETGNETYTLGLIEGLVDSQEDFELFLYHGGVVPAHLTHHIHQRRLITRAPWIRLAFDLPARSLVDRIDVLHTTYTVPIWVSCPEVVTVHDISFASHPEWFSKRDLRVLSAAVPWSIRRADRVITVSELCRKEIIERFRVPEEKVVCIYDAAGPARQEIGKDEAARAIEHLGIDPSHSIVLAVGNLQPRKNLIRLIDAFAGLVDDGVDAQLLIVGPEHYRAELIRTAGDRLSSRIRMTGYLSDRQLAACYEAASVFVFPSLFEGFGIPALEAMAHGTPVASSTGGALPEVCGDAAVYFDPTDVSAMAATLRQLLEDGALRERLSRAGRARERQFSWQTAARQTLSVYRDTIGRSPMRQTTN